MLRYFLCCGIVVRPRVKIICKHYLGLNPPALSNIWILLILIIVIR
jgi:hypothetical protein